MNKLNSPYIFYAVIGVYLLLGLVNLAYIPIPWLDEAACLEPAVQWHKTGQYISKAWPTEGTEQIFLTYPPLIMWLHILNLYIVPLDVFWIRLPFLLIHVTSIILLYNLIRNKYGISAMLALLACCLFVFDKAVFEISRSVRSEVIEIWLILLFLHLIHNKRHAFFSGLILGAMLLSHLKLWPIVGIFAIWGSIRIFDSQKKWIFIGGIAALPLLFLLFINFNIGELWRQMFTHSMVHAADGNLGHKIYDFFIGRFFPVYKEHPWVPLLHVCMLLLASVNLVTKRGNAMLSTAFLVGSLVWVFTLGPYYRYWPPMYLLGMIILVEWLGNQKINVQRFFKWYSFPFWLLLLFPFVSRHLLGIVQRPERNPKAMEAFLLEYISTKEKTLFFGADIGIYVSGKHKKMDFTHVTSPDHFEFEDYRYVYYVTDVELSLRRLATYKPETLALPSWMYKLGKGGTFANTHIYLIRTKEEWESVAKDFYQKNTK